MGGWRDGRYQLAVLAAGVTAALQARSQPVEPFSEDAAMSWSLPSSSSGRDMAARVRSVLARAESCRPPCLLLSGGETTVTVRGSGCGGRNVEFLLGFGMALGPCEGVHALAADTDGVDGMAAVAGALWHPDTLARAAARGLDPLQFLDENDAHGTENRAQGNCDGHRPRTGLPASS